MKFIEIPRGGVGPKHSAFCGACFSINPYSVQKCPKSIKVDPKNHEPSVFFMRHFRHFLIKFDPPKPIFIIYNLSTGHFINLLTKQFYPYTIF
jgi:hypothetical protein